MRDSDVTAILLLLGFTMAISKRTSLELGGGWTWPMPELDELEAAHAGVKPRPAISDGVGARKRGGGTRDHKGVDIMYKRIAQAQLPRRGESRWFMVPAQTPVLAARAGRIWSAGLGPRGHWVILDHGPELPYTTFYTHLSELFVPHVTTRLMRNTVHVLRGQRLGICGADPMDPAGVVHLHFEVRRGATPIDPEPDIHHWGYVKS